MRSYFRRGDHFLGSRTQPSGGDQGSKFDGALVVEDAACREQRGGRSADQALRRAFAMVRKPEESMGSARKAQRRSFQRCRTKRTLNAFLGRHGRARVRSMPTQEVRRDSENIAMHACRRASSSTHASKCPLNGKTHNDYLPLPHPFGCHEARRAAAKPRARLWGRSAPRSPAGEDGRAPTGANVAL